MNSSDSSNMRSTASSKDLFLFEIPAMQRHNLCCVLDELNIWPELAVSHMGYNKSDLQDIRRAIQQPGISPSDVLITMWGEQNHTITELFILLYRMQQYPAMDIIRDLVDRKYHRLIFSGQPDLSNLISKQNEKKKTEKILNRDPEILSDTNNESSNTSSYTSSTDPNSNNISTTDNFKNANKYASTIPQIDYKELVEATNNWNDKNILGKGGFGIVFKGIWKYTSVAIKKIEYKGSGSAEVHKIQVQQSLNELRFLNSCRHDNILPLYGYSINGDEPCLVYQLMTGGSLEYRLNSPKNPLTWSQRLNIARGTARGLQYLHTFREKPLIHGDIKPANILLDPCNQPKIGDFGLAREGPNALNSSMEVSRVYGTKPYLPVEFLGYKCLSTKVDTYSFGVVLLELVTGLRAYDRMREHKFLTKHIMVKCSENAPIESLIDKSIPMDPESVNIYKSLIQIGRACISERPEQRPEMVMVLWHLLTK